MKMKPGTGRILPGAAAILLAAFWVGNLSGQEIAENKLPNKATTRWQISSGSYAGVERFAVDELQRMVQRYFPYVIGVRSAGDSSTEKSQLILVGTATNHRLIAELGERKLIPLPGRPQGYTIGFLDSPWNSRMRLAVIAGADPPGVLYGVEEFNRRLAIHTPGDPVLARRTFDDMKDFTVSEAPIIENRGIWSWGYVIYDYRRFLDNMARLKMNRLTIWNDTRPVNCRELIAYAHSRGIKVILGFHWGWGVKNLDLANPDDLRTTRDRVLLEYGRDYQDLGMDGIYFQTATETSRTAEGGRTIASLACDWVNNIAGALLKKHPGLRIEFGLHATSILENYMDLKPLDPRIVIVWEDAGVIPYAYDPVVVFPEGRGARGLKTLQATIDYSTKLATFRPGSEFAMVAKGWTTLRWTKLEHQSDVLLGPLDEPFILGEWPHAFIAERARERQPRWDYVNAAWLENYSAALRFFREIGATSAAPMTVLALIEDGLFEQHIQVSVALLGEMLWNPRREQKQYLERAINPYYYGSLLQ